ncbi:hypothetical protein BDZ45DRAFT_740942 [Acephala macrosclerotiorum]|nr:hypothetical protein BDZ45DRAFT_740942 [Acephala macrosclerotiorum]
MGGFLRAKLSVWNSRNYQWVGIDYHWGHINGTCDAIRAWYNQEEALGTSNKMLDGSRDKIFSIFTRLVNLPRFYNIVMFLANGNTVTYDRMPVNHLKYSPQPTPKWDPDRVDMIVSRATHIGRGRSSLISNRGKYSLSLDFGFNLSRELQYQDNGSESLVQLERLFKKVALGMRLLVIASW